MKLIITLGCLIALSGCVSPKIPDDVPPAPPARKGDPYTAPSLGGDEEVEEEGFGGGGGFGGETPTVEVKAGDLPDETETEPDEGGDKKDGDKKNKPTKKDEAKKDGAKKDEAKKDAESEAKPKESSEN